MKTGKIQQQETQNNNITVDSNVFDNIMKISGKTIIKKMMKEKTTR
jgi:hypothetical protein